MSRRKINLHSTIFKLILSTQQHFLHYQVYLHSTIFKLIRINEYGLSSDQVNLHSTIFKLIHKREPQATVCRIIYILLYLN